MSYQRSDKKGPVITRDQRVVPDYNNEQRKYTGYNGGQYEHHGPDEEEEEEEETSMNGFGKGKTILVIAIVIGCFAVLWPKIFAPMFFGETPSPPKTDEGYIPHLDKQLPDHLSGAHPAMQERGRMGAHPGMGPVKPAGRAPPVRTIDKEWGGRGPMPGMRPTMGGPGVQQQQPKGGGTMGVMMPIYTVGIVIFFIYTTMKVMFKNKNNDEREDEDVYNRKGYEGDNHKYDEEYYNEYIRQYREQQEHIRAQQEEHQIINTSNGCLQEEKVDIKDQQNCEDAQNQEIKEAKDLKEKLVEESHNEEEIPPPSACGVNENDQNLEMGNEKMDKKDRYEMHADGNNITEEKKPIEPSRITDVKNKLVEEPGEDVDPRDLEISLLKARLEETEKAMQKIVAHLGNLTSRLGPHLLNQTTNGLIEDSEHCSNGKDDKHILEKKQCGGCES